MSPTRSKPRKSARKREPSVVETPPKTRGWLAWLLGQQRELVLFFCALVLRCTYLLQINGSPFFRVLLGDGQAYDAWAQQILQDFWGKQAFFQAPLYPYFLAFGYSVVGRDLILVRVIQMLLGACSCVLLARATRTFFSPKVGWLAGYLLALYGPALFFDGIVQKASLDLFLTTGLLYWLARAEERSERRFVFAAGVTLGCLALTRENSLIWLPSLLVWFAWRGRDRVREVARQRLAPLFLGTALVLTPVALRNWYVADQFVLTSSQFGQNFYIGNNEDADGTYRSLRFGHGGAEAERQDATEIAEAALGRKLGPAEVSHYWTARAQQFIRNDPGKWLRLLLKKSLLVFNREELADSDEPRVYEDDSWLLEALSSVFSFRNLLPLALVGIFLTRRKSEPRVLHVLWPTLAASTALFFVFARYRYPLVPLLLPFAGAAIVELRALAWREAVREKWACLAIACGGIALVQLPLVPSGHPRATAYYDLAVSLEAQDRPRDAIEAYSDALRSYADFVEAHVNLGALLAQDGELAEAAAHELAALRLRPSDALARANLGNVYFEQQRYDEAQTEYERSLALDPTQPQAKAGLEAVHDARKKTPPAASH